MTSLMPVETSGHSYASLKGDVLISRLMEDEAVALGMNVVRMSKRLICCRKEGVDLAFYRSCSNGSSHAAKLLCDNKEHAKGLLAETGLSIAPHRAFDLTEVEAAAAYADRLGWNVVVKPCLGSRARGISSGIKSSNALRAAWEFAAASRARLQPSRIMVEKHFSGSDHRFFVVGDKVIGALRRDPARVEGDGVATIRALIAAKDESRRKNPDLSNRPILVDAIVRDALRSRGFTLDTVLPAGAVVPLRGAPDREGPLFPAGKGGQISAGGESVDVTDEAHEGFREIAVRALRAIPGLTHGGCDILADDITQAPTRSNHVVTEVEFDPSISMHHFPARGRPRNVAREILLHCLRERTGLRGA